MQNALIELPGIHNATVRRQKSAILLTPSSLHVAPTLGVLPSERSLTGHFIQSVSLGEITKYTNSYVGSEFGRGVPIYGTPQVTDSYLLSIRDSLNSLLDDAYLASKQDIRNVFVGQNAHIFVYCNHTSIKASINIDICQNKNRQPKEQVLAPLFSLFVDYGIISLDQIMPITGKGLTNKVFRMNQEKYRLKI